MSKSMIARYIPHAPSSSSTSSSSSNYCVDLKEKERLNFNDDNNNEDTQVNYELEKLEKNKNDQVAVDCNEIIVGECLSALVDSVSREQQQRQSFESFKLHEAILAKTRSASVTASSSSSSSSSDNDNDDCGQSSECANQSMQWTNLNCIGRANFVGKFQIQLEQWNREMANKHSAFIKELSKQFYNEQNVNTNNDHCWSLQINSQKILWTTSANNSDEFVNNNEIFDCLNDGHLLIWIVSSVQQRQQNENKNPTTSVGSCNGLDLDDIALALNEPISGGSGNKYFNNNEQQQQQQANKRAQTVSSLHVIVWSCASFDEATKLFKTWRQCANNEKLLSSSVGKEEEKIEKNLLLPSETRINVEIPVLAVATDDDAKEKQVAQSSGLFVLPLVECEEEENKTMLMKDESICAPVCAPRNSLVNASSKLENDADDEKQQQANFQSQLGESFEQNREQLTNGQQQQQKKKNRFQVISREQQAERRKRQLYETISKSSGLTVALSQANFIPTPRRGFSQQKSTCNFEQVHKATATTMHENNVKVDNNIDELDELAVVAAKGNIIETPNGSWLNAASKMFNSSSNRIKNFKEEMIKLNQTGCNSLASVARERAKRLSMKINQHSSLLNLNQIETHTNGSSSSELDNVCIEPSAPPPPLVKPRTSILKQQQQQQMLNDSNQQVANQSCEKKLIVQQKPVQPKSILKKRISQNANSELQNFPLKSAIKTKTTKVEKSSTPNMQRRSIAVQAQSTLIDDKNVKSVELNDSDDDDEQAFDRLKQRRASCYDLSRLVTKELIKSEKEQVQKIREEQQQQQQQQSADNLVIKNELKSQNLYGKSISSINFSLVRTKSHRQRVPAMLLLNESKLEKEGKQEKEEEEEVGCCKTPNAISQSNKISKTLTSSGSDGLVRAQVSVAHLNVKKKQFENEEDRFSLPNTSCKRRQSILVPIGGKKSEFDPRSLRKLPKDIALSLKLGTKISAHEKEEEGREEGEGEDKISNKSQVALVCDSIKKQISGKKTEANRQSTEDEEEEEELEEEANNLVAKLTYNNQNVIQDTDKQETSSSQASSNFLNKSKRLSLFRQSFNQKALSSMLRASLRVKPSSSSSSSATNAAASATAADQSLSAPAAAAEQATAVSRSSGPIKSCSKLLPLESEHSKSSSTVASSSKLDAIRVAEANLLAARQLKYQAQKLKEQQKRVEQQQASIESAAARLFHTQQQQQQQQQMVLSQQHYGVAAAATTTTKTRGLHHPMVACTSAVADPFVAQLRLQMQQQQQQQFAIQRQQYQQMVFMGQQQQQQQQSAVAHFLTHHQQQQQQHFMYAAASMASLVQPQPTYGTKFPPLPMPIPMPYPFAIDQHHPHQHQHQQQQQQHQHQHQHQHQQAAQPLVAAPMSVNHHSSFNIVYAPTTPAATISMQQPNNQHYHIPMAPTIVAANQAHQQHQPAQSNHSNHFQRAKQSSLGASVRKTVKSFLQHTSKSSTTTTTTTAAAANAAAAIEVEQQQQPPLKSALRSSNKAKVVVVSEQKLANNEEQTFGSDGELAASQSSPSNSSSSASSTSSACPPETTIINNKSTLKKTASSSTSSSSSSATSDLDHTNTITTSSPPHSTSSSSSLSPKLSSSSSSSSSTLRGSDAELLRQQLLRCQLNSNRKSATLSRSSSSSRAINSKKSSSQNNKQQIVAATATSQRKNVTFSTKLTTSIL